MFYREMPLPPPARQSAFCAWRFELEAGDPPVVEHNIPPDGTTNLVLVRSPEGAQFVSLVGPSLAAEQTPVTRGWRYCGLRLRPEKVRAVVGRLPAPAQREFLEPEGRHEPIWGDLGRMLDGVTDWAGTCALLASAPPADPVVAAAVDAIVASGGSVPMTQLARWAGLSERQFRRRFVAATGIAPKFYADVQRVRRALILSLQDKDWAGVAAEAGFADQPHLTRDVKERFGAAPGQIGGYFRGMRHELVAPVDGRFVQDGEAQAA